ncbi:MAG: class I SAM-dependent methyltransferase [Ignavibacteriaceae bacterium]
MAQDNFSQVSDLYAKYRPAYPKEMYDFIFSHLSNMDKAWDCATGSGQVASYLAGHFKEVYANDISPQQLSYAPRKDNIKYFNVPSEDTGFMPNYFDLITVAQAVHWFDFNKFYDEVRRTAKNGALLAVFGYGQPGISDAINILIKNFDDDTFSRYFQEQRRYVIQELKTIPFPFKEIPNNGFIHKTKWLLDDLEGFLNSWSSVQKIKTEEGYNPVDGLMEKIKMYWEKGEIKEVNFPVFLRLGIIVQ